MKLHQLSLFLENKPKQMRTPIAVLADAGVNLIAASLADTREFGILRLIVGDWEKAKRTLEDAGCVVNVTEVVAIEVPDHPGGLDSILTVIEDADVNIEYMYAFTSGREDKAVLVFRFEDPDAAAHALQSAGINLISSMDLADRT
jgi:hypothetical protein